MTYSKFSSDPSLHLGVIVNTSYFSRGLIGIFSCMALEGDNTGVDIRSSESVFLI
jgi:hypothetical protein